MTFGVIWVLAHPTKFILEVLLGGVAAIIYR